MRNRIIFSVLLFVIGVYIVGHDALASTAKAAATTEEKKYTEEEFKTAVLEEATKLMKKAGSANLVGFSKELIEKEDDLKKREMNLAKQVEQLKKSEDNLKNQLIEFQDSQKKFLGCVDEKNEKEKQRVAQMVEVIAGMKPQNAADLLAVQDAELTVKILGELDTQKTSKIFNLMNKEVSARLQKQFLQMKK